MTSPIQSGTQSLPVETSEELPKSKQSLGLTIRAAAQLPAEIWPDERISAIRAYVGKEATTIAELAAFLATCQRYSLDPMVGQLFLIASRAGPKVVTGRDTWLALARREPGYGGTAFGTVHTADEFGHKRTEDGRITVHHVVTGVKRGALIGAYAHVKDRFLGDNIEVRELQDFNHLLTKDNWKNFKADMLQNRCIAAVLRKEYGFPGLLVAGEEDDVLGDPTSRTMPPADAVTAAPKGAGATLAAVVQRAQAERVPAEDALDVAIEADDRQPGEEEVEPNAGHAEPPPVVESTPETRRAAELVEGRASAWKEFSKLRAKKTMTGLEQVRFDLIVADYPDFLTTKVSE